MKANLVQLLIGAGLLVGVPALANGVRYDFIGSSAGDWQLFGPPESSRPILDTTAPGSVLDDPTTTFWNRAVNPGMTVDGRFTQGFVYRFTGRFELGNGVFGQYLMGETNGSTSGLLVNFENHAGPNGDLFAVGSLGGGSPFVMTGLNFNGALSYDFTLTLLNYYTAEVTGRISDSSRVIWDSTVSGTRTVLLDQPVGVLDARIAMSDGGAAFNILELSWSGVAIPEPSSALFVLVGLAAFTVRRWRNLPA
jgi:hypothetical protein